MSPVMNGHGRVVNGGGLPADISKELEKRNIGHRYNANSTHFIVFQDKIKSIDKLFDFNSYFVYFLDQCFKYLRKES